MIIIARGKLECKLLDSCQEQHPTFDLADDILIYEAFSKGALLSRIWRHKFYASLAATKSVTYAGDEASMIVSVVVHSGE